MTLTDLTRNTPIRLAATFVALFSGAMILTFLLVYWQVGHLLDRRLLASLTETRDELMMVARRDGFQALQDVVQSEAATIRNSDTILLVTDRNGAFIVGNVHGITPFTGTRGIARATMPEMASRLVADDRFISSWSDFEGGRLLVGLSDRDVQATRRFILAGLGLGLVGTVILAGLSGLWLAHRAKDRVDAFSKTLHAVSRGRLDQRVPLAGRGDDLDQVGSELNAAIDRLARLIERVNQSSAAIAHELRSPIGRVRQKLERLLDQATPGADAEAPIKSALAEVDHVVEIIEAILRIGQIRAGARRERFAPVDLPALIADVAEVYHPVVEESGLTVVCLPPLTSASVLGDQQLLTQMFANLIENAVRHAGAGHTIELSLDDTPDGPMAWVCDDGPGIPEAQRQRMLEPFARLDQSRTTPGAGLGLSLVAAIAELHGARLELADNGPGLAVNLCFPRLPAGA